MISLPRLIAGLLLLGLLLAPWPAVSLPRAVRVRGVIEIVNAKVRNRNGDADRSGVVVWLDQIGGAPQRAARPSRLVMTQRGKRFIPHVLAVEVGSEVDFPNEDPFFHNVFSIFDGRRFDLGLYASGETRPVNFNRPGISYIFCNIHPQMSAIVLALETPYHAQSNSRGAFEIASVPEGRYRLKVWHERATPEHLSTLARNIQVGSSDLDLGIIRLSEEGYIPRPHRNKHGEEYDPKRNRPAYRRP